MPCRHYDDIDEARMATADAAAQRKRAEEATAIADEVTRLLCLAVRRLKGAEIPLGRDLDAWAKKHAKRDRARRGQRA